MNTNKHLITIPFGVTLLPLQLTLTAPCQLSLSVMCFSGVSRHKQGSRALLWAYGIYQHCKHRAGEPPDPAGHHARTQPNDSKTFHIPLRANHLPSNIPVPLCPRTAEWSGAACQGALSVTVFTRCSPSGSARSRHGSTRSGTALLGSAPRGAALLPAGGSCQRASPGATLRAAAERRGPAGAGGAWVWAAPPGRRARGRALLRARR